MNLPGGVKDCRGGAGVSHSPMILLLVVGSSDCTASNSAIACLQPHFDFVCTIYGYDLVVVVLGLNRERG